MAKKSKAKPKATTMLPLDTPIEVIGLREGFKLFKKEMTFGESLSLPKKRGWKYITYQLGYSQFKTD